MLGRSVCWKWFGAVLGALFNSSSCLIPFHPWMIHRRSFLPCRRSSYLLILPFLPWMIHRRTFLPCRRSSCYLIPFHPWMILRRSFLPCRRSSCCSSVIRWERKKAVCENHVTVKNSNTLVLLVNSSHKEHPATIHACQSDRRVDRLFWPCNTYENGCTLNG